MAVGGAVVVAVVVFGSCTESIPATLPRTAVFVFQAKFARLETPYTLSIADDR